MGGYARLQNKRRELGGRGRGKEGGGKRGRQDGQREGEGEHVHQQISKTRTQNLKDLVAAMNPPAQAEQPENMPQEVLGKTCVVQN